MKTTILRISLILSILSLTLMLSAQVTGQVIGNDAPDGLEGATVRLRSPQNVYQTDTEANGNFTFGNVYGTAAGIEYELRVTLIGYQTYETNVTVRNEPLDLDTIRIDEEPWVPRNVVATVEDDNANIEWEEPRPFDGEEQWIHWDSGVNQGNAIGVNGPAQFSVAARFSAAQLAELEVAGMFINTIRFFPAEEQATYTLKVWRNGYIGPLNPGQEITSQVVQNPVIGEWNEVTLDNPVQIFSEQEIWFGYYINTQAGFPAGCDPGPAVNMYGNVMHFEGAWTTLRALNSELNFNWNLQAYVGGMRGEESIALNPSTPSYEQYNIESYNNITTNNELSVTNINPTRMSRVADRTGRPEQYRVLEEYDIYRLRVEDEENPDNWTQVGTTTETYFTDTTWSDADNGYYKFAVVAVYTDGIYSDPVLSNFLGTGVQFTLTGRVAGSDEPEGLGDAVVIFDGIGNYRATTQANGSFEITDILGSFEGTEYVLTILREGYSPHESIHNVTVENLDIGTIILDEFAFPAKNVVAELVADESVDVSWNEPDKGFWLHWDSGENADGIGTGGAAEFAVAARYTPEQLNEMDVVGFPISMIRFFPRVAAATYTVKVWTGGSMNPPNPGVEVVSQVVPNINAEQWNEVMLNEHYLIEPGQEVWFGYSVNTPSGHPAGTDAGPAIDGYGNMIYIDGEWQTLLEVNNTLDNNWNIQALAGTLNDPETLAIISNNYLDTLSSERQIAQQIKTYTSSGNSYINLELASDRGILPSSDWRPGRAVNRMRGRDNLQERGLEDYVLYRFDFRDIGNQDLWTELAVQEETTYTDNDWVNFSPGIYHYAVVARYENNIHSQPVFSNGLAKDMYATAIVNVSSNSGDPIDGAQVTLTNIDGEPEHRYTEIVGQDGVIEFSDVWRGTYTITARLEGFDNYLAEDVEIWDDIFTYELELIEALLPVEELTYEMFGDNNVRLTWEEPGLPSGTEQWFHWDSGNNNDGIGAGGSAFTVAARFTSAQLVELDVAGLHLTSIRFFPRVAGATYTMKVWTGGSGSPLNAGQQVLSQVATNVNVENWNEVVLNAPVMIEEGQELWIGYEVTSYSDFPAGTDAGPAVENYGNLIYLNNQWQTTNTWNLDYNINVQGYAGFPSREESRLLSRNQSQQDVRESHLNRELLGYKILRNEELLAEEITDLYFEDYDLQTGSYVYSVIAQYTTGESIPVETEDILIVGIEDQDALPLVTQLQGNYPNPFNPDTRISFTLAEESEVNLEIYNLRGQRVRTLVNERMTSGNHSVVWDGKNDGNLEVSSGIYFYRMKSGDYVTSKKMILMK